GINNPKRYNYVDSLLLINNKLSFRDSTDFKWLDDENISAWRRDKIKADKYFYDGEYDKALSLYSNSLDKSEKNYIEELKAKIIYCHFSLGETSVAITILSELLSKGANPRTLPINTVAEYVAKEGHYKTKNDELYNEAIILNAYNKNIIAKYIQHTSNVCENFLENIDVTDKNQITFENESIPAFFLTELLSIDVLEGMTSIIESEVDVLLTRLKIDRYIVTNEEKFDRKTVRKSKNEI
ncbi:tetratricopeptide repeat protein, partial [Yersinia enterocolitica]|uniref:tetratricopeptide repeat protein n=1 Tax=Yersinia enterocolitica TaxID=630 RepID=UPI00313E6758